MMYLKKFRLLESVIYKSLYHGTNKEFDEFSNEFLKDGVEVRYGEGFYFTENINEAKEFGDIILVAELTIENAFIWEEEQMKELDSMGIKYDKYTNMGGNLKRKTDYDAIINGDVYIVFDANQIKITGQV